MTLCELIGIEKTTENWKDYVMTIVGVSLLIFLITGASYFITMNNIYGNILERQGTDLNVLDKFNDDLGNHGYKVFVDHPELVEIVQRCYKEEKL